MHGLLLLQLMVVVVMMNVVYRIYTECMNGMVDDTLDQCLTVTANVALACRRLPRQLLLLLLSAGSGDGYLSGQPVPKEKPKPTQQCKQRKNRIE